MPAAPPAISHRLVVALVFVVLLAAFEQIYGPFLPLENGRVGHDYALALPSLLDGKFWFDNNGLAPPWFTPAFCAGQPFFADPQSLYYSLPQFLSFAVSPLAAMHLLLLACAASLFWGGYLLMRRVFDVGPAAAVLVGGLLMFNGFLPHRLLVGHIGYHGFALVPWLALLLLAPVASVRNGLAAAVAAGLLLAYWVHSAFGTLILAGALAIFLVAVVHALAGGSLARFVARGALAGVVGLGLAAAKLWAGFSLLAHFPRTFYALPGAASVHDAIVMLGGALFLPSQLAHAVGAPRLVNLQWDLAPHEWAFNFGGVALVLGLVLVVALLRRQQVPRRPLLWALLLLGLLWPLAFNVWHPGWNAFLKSIPVLNSASTPLRWTIVYIPFVAVALGLLLARVQWGRGELVATGVCLLATVGQSAFEPRDYYSSQNYDVRPVLFADQRLQAEAPAPRITGLGTGAELAIGKTRVLLVGNDTMVAGVSQVSCYNPLFGYRLENFSAAGLQAGSVLAEQAGFLNLKNPACYVFPAENGCRPGDRFRADQAAAAKNFSEYRTFEFAVSAGQKVANAVTLATALAVAMFALTYLYRKLARTSAA